MFALNMYMRYVYQHHHLDYIKHVFI